ncbi:NADH-ubiquinone oxidoreductase chain 5 [Platanthera guangdongensis]|uniref:NADH-ubiquinone oxidoreductase chain 5 n=1 Tax=Platanthera guangdongensis TaxID=2320717 RepID=A0ABR2LRG7_9ASPA
MGSLSLIGFPFPTGFYSKDVILELAYTKALFVWAFRCSVLSKRPRKEGKQMNLRRCLLRSHPPALKNASKSSF